MTLTDVQIQLIASAIAFIVFTILIIRRHFTNIINDLKIKVKSLEKDKDDLAQGPKNTTKFIIEFLNKHKESSKEEFKKLSGNSQFQFSLGQPIEHQAILLRAYYLKVELLALKWIEDDDKYWKSLSKNLTQIFCNLGLDQQHQELQQKIKTIKVLEKKLEMAAADDTLPPVTSQNLISNAFDNIQEIKQSLNSATQKNSEKQEIVNQLSTLNVGFEDYEDNVSHLRTAVNTSESDIQTLTEKIRALTNEIEFLKNLKSECDANGLSIDSELISSNAHKLANDQSKESVLNQISQLRENNEQQRNFIIKLRNNISELENEVSSKPGLSDDDLQQKLLEIERLEKIVAEFEHCVFSLESEVDLLHEQLRLLEQSPEKSNVNESKEVEHELLELKEQFENTMQTYKDQCALTDFAMEAAKCEKVIELLVVLNNCFQSLDVKSAFHIRTEITHNKSIPSGFLSSKEETLLTQEVMPPQGEQFKIGNKMYYWNSHISFIIGDFPDDEKRRSQIIDSIAILKNIATSEIIRIESSLSSQRQNKTILRLLSATQKELADIDIQQQYQSMEYKNIIESMYQQVDQIKDLPNISEDIILIVESLKKESKVRTEILESTGTLVSSGFTNLLESLNKKLSKEAQ